jgi:hypothetical protein
VKHVTFHEHTLTYINRFCTHMLNLWSKPRFVKFLLAQAATEQATFFSSERIWRPDRNRQGHRTRHGSCMRPRRYPRTYGGAIAYRLAPTTTPAGRPGARASPSKKTMPCTPEIAPCRHAPAYQAVSRMHRMGDRPTWTDGDAEQIWLSRVRGGWIDRQIIGALTDGWF